MKKWFIALLILALLEICIYIFIPGDLIISKLASINCTLNGAARHIADERKWRAAWGNDTAGTTVGFHIESKLSNGADIFMETKDNNYPSRLELFSKGSDSIILQWRCHLQSGLNPFKRVSHYFQAIRIKKNMDLVVKNIRLFLENPKNIYGMEIHITSTKDTALVATKEILGSYPTTNDIYGLLAPIRKYISGMDAQETGSPMLNVTRLIDNRFEIMVAIPTSRELLAQGKIFFRKLIPGGFMVSEVHGGQWTVDHALDQMQLYLADYNKTAVAIPFQSLITDRSRETDTSKWVTRIYAPVVR